ncbi:MAG: hypothetical protein H6625_08395 [Bdellovibrionaceae bacterium]|nr:hypothetical protein [Pseudobdellovibrionaceae bacterium]
MSKDTFFKTTTTDYSTVYIRKEHVSALEYIPSKGSLDPVLKLYVNGYSFKVKGSKEDFFKELGIQTKDTDDEE